MKPYDMTLVSTADWDNPFWTNKQHVARELARIGHRVLYINSLGLRTPTLKGRDIKRILRRLKRALVPPRQVEPNLWVWSPILLPFQRFAAVRAFNRVFLGTWLGLWQKLLGFRRDIMWTYNPLTTRLFATQRYTTLVYHCVDEIAAQPGMPQDIITRADEELCKASHVVFTTAPALQKSREKLNPNTFYFSNVADAEHFGKAMAAETVVPKDMASLSKPVIGFIGAISGYKLDFDLLVYVAKANPTFSFVLIGDIGEGDPHTQVGELGTLTNVHFLGPKPYGNLPAYLKGMDVAILPSRLNTYTRNMFPMKFFEYLAAGRPVVATNLDALQDYAEYVYLAKDAKDFNAGLQHALTRSATLQKKCLTFAAGFTYATRNAKMLDIIAGLRGERLKRT